jgi:hypothetical protein
MRPEGTLLTDGQMGPGAAGALDIEFIVSAGEGLARGSRSMARSSVGTMGA